MPFIVTTKRPCGAYPDGHPWEPEPVSRLAVATLEEARALASDAMGGNRQGDGPPPDVIAQTHVSESGGTIGPLPDGTMIEVEAVAA